MRRFKKKMENHDDEWFAAHDNRYWKMTRFICFWGSVLSMILAIVAAGIFIGFMPRNCDPEIDWYHGTVTLDVAPSLNEKNVPSYKEFVHRFTVLSLYRGFMKCIRDSMPHNKEDLRDQVRKEFQMNKSDTDPFSIKQNIADGQRRFEELQEFTGQSNKYSGDSWINIQDPDDPRGRVGTGWPWAK